MGIDSKHPHYNDALPQWERVRDCFKGGDSIKDRGTDYLPQLSGQDDTDYDSYKMRADYFGGVERTVSGLVGAVMRIDPIVDASEKLKAYFDDVTNSGVSLNDLISNMLSEQLLMNRQGLFVDWNSEESRPYLVGYKTEQIINWLDDAIILEETYREEGKTKYDSEFKTQYRELTFDDSKYVVNVWRKVKNEWEIIEDQSSVPDIKGEAITKIPFIGIGEDGFNLTPGLPSMLSLSDVSLSMYRNSADLEHGRHLVALPTPYVTGVDDTTELNIGPGTAWLLPPGSTAGYLEFSGNGLRALETAIDSKRSQMASLGAQFLQSQKAGVESGESIRLRQNAEASTLVRSVKLVERAIENALQSMAEWMGDSQAVSVNLNVDFVDSQMSPQDIQALMMAWQSGGISHDTLLWNLKRGEILNPDTSVEDEKANIDMDIPDLTNE